MGDILRLKTSIKVPTSLLVEESYSRTYDRPPPNFPQVAFTVLGLRNCLPALVLTTWISQGELRDSTGDNTSTGMLDRLAKDSSSSSQTMDEGGGVLSSCISPLFSFLAATSLLLSTQILGFSWMSARSFAHINRGMYHYIMEYWCKC